MKKYIKIAKGAVGMSMVAGMGSGVVSKLGGSTAGIDTFSSMMPAAVSLEMGKTMIGSFRRRRRKR